MNYLDVIVYFEMSFPDVESVHPAEQLEFQIHPSTRPEHLPGQTGPSFLSSSVFVPVF